jgi:protein-S-isoprenylcysteine O-methyltransferase Ste14
VKKDWFYVSIQFLLFAAFLVAPNTLFDYSMSFTVAPLVSYMCLISTIIGLIVIIISLWQLNVNLSAFPTPKKGAYLVQHGIFKFVRHPIYSGILLSAISWSVYSENFWRFIIVLLLVLLFYFKARYEETKLINHFPAYRKYMEKTGRFIPKLNNTLN